MSFARPKKKYVIKDDSVVEVFEVDDTYLILDPHFILRKGEKIFDNKLDALYTKLILALEKGTGLSNYKSSKYYNDYLERLKIENPEYLI